MLQEGEVRPLGATGSVKVDVRVVAATHCNLPEKIKSGEFREDLFFRLNVFPIVLPALRDRDADIKLLLDHFVKKYTRLYGKRIAGISPTALDLLLNYPFPGNVRELQNAIERAVLLCEDGGSLLIEHLPESIQDCTQGRVVVGRRSGETLIHQSRAMQDFSSLKKAVNAYEISVIEQHLQANNWNQTRTAETLQIPRRTLIDKMSRYNIKTPDRKKRRSL